MTDLAKVLEDRAATVVAPPPDLAGRIEARHRRRRSRRATAASFAAVLVLAGGAWAVVRPPEQPASPGPFVVPADFRNPAPISEFPGAIVADDVPARSDMWPLAVLDAGRILFADEDTFYRYDIRARDFTVLVPEAGAAALVGDSLGDRDGFAVTPQWIVWPDGSTVYRAPVTGGPRERIAEVGDASGTMNWFADGGNVYWSYRSSPGVTRMSVADGTTERLPGFADVRVDGSPWAFRLLAPDGPVAEYRNVLTGERREVFQRAGQKREDGSLDHMSLGCVPDFCLDHTEGEWIVRRPDGSNPAVLNVVGGVSTIVRAGTRGLVLTRMHGALLDPQTGRLGAVSSGPTPESCNAVRQVGTMSVIDNRANKKCAKPSRMIFLT